MNAPVKGFSVTKTLAHKTCRDRGWTFAEVFKHQFIISQAPTLADKTWQAKTLGEWTIQHCPSLEQIEVSDASGDVVAVLIGLAVDGEAAELLSGTHKLRTKTLEGVERFIERLSGRFLALVVKDGAPRVYFDPTGGISAVYSKDEAAVCSNPTLVLNRALRPPQGVTSEAVMDRQDRFYLGETSDRGFRRIFANHFLDLETFELVRHWPKSDAQFVASPDQLDDIAQNIQTRLRGIMSALAKNRVCSLPVTAGKDSRILMSAALPCLDEINTFYSFAINKMTRLDCRVSRNIAWQYGFPHQVLSKGTKKWKEAYSDEEVKEVRDQMALRTGDCYNGRDDAHVRALALAPETEVTFRGNLCEITRANKYRRPFPEEGFTQDRAFNALLELTPEAAAERIEAKRLKRLRADYARWADSLPEEAQARLIDFAHCEHWLPSIGNTEYYAYAQSIFVNPFNDRDLLLWTLSVDPTLRKKDELVTRIVKAGDPKLLKIPFLYQYAKQIAAAEEKGINPYAL